MNVKAINEKWKEYELGKNESDCLVKCILTDLLLKQPPFRIIIKCNCEFMSKKELQAYLQHGKKTLVTGGNIINVTDALTWIDWFHELTKNGFLGLAYPATFICQKENNRSLNTFPQNNGDTAIISIGPEYILTLRKMYVSVRNLNGIRRVEMYWHQQIVFFMKARSVLCEWLKNCNFAKHFHNCLPSNKRNCFGLIFWHIKHR